VIFSDVLCSVLIQTDAGAVFGVVSIHSNCVSSSHQMIIPVNSTTNDK